MYKLVVNTSFDKFTSGIPTTASRISSVHDNYRNLELIPYKIVIVGSILGHLNGEISSYLEYVIFFPSHNIVTVI